MHITFWGAAETVTGSRFVVDTGSARVLVDCGLFQGPKRLREQNRAGFPVDPASIAGHGHARPVAARPRPRRPALLDQA